MGDVDADGRGDLVARAPLDDATGTDAGIAYWFRGGRDGDGDGILEADDCDDADSSVHPGAPDDPDDGVDSNCDGAVEEPPDTGETGETGASGDTGETDSADTSGDPLPDDTSPEDTGKAEAGGCGCGSPAPHGGGIVLGVVALVLRRRRS